MVCSTGEMKRFALCQTAQIARTTSTQMIEAGYITAMLLGLLGGVHCAAMCGGIVSALTLQPRGGQTVSMPSKTVQVKPSFALAMPLHLAYNLGRISGYVLAGAALGAIGSMGMLLNHILPIQMALYVFANLLLIALGVYLAGFTASLGWIERGGQFIWRHIQPCTRRFLPARSVVQAYPLGVLWGFLPCGMVYSVLATALLSGSAERGGLLMLAFGLGTLPNLLLAGFLLHRLQRFTRHPVVRTCAGLVVGGFGVYGLAHAASLGEHLWQGVVCHV